MKKYLIFILFITLIVFDYFTFIVEPNLKSIVLILYLGAWAFLLKWIPMCLYKIGKRDYMLSDVVFFTTLLNFAIIGSISTYMGLK